MPVREAGGTTGTEPTKEGAGQSMMRYDIRILLENPRPPTVCAKYAGN